MFTIYSDKDIFENMISFPEIYPNWNKIINNHATVCLDINEHDLTNELTDDESILFLFLQSNARQIDLIPLDSFFKTISSNPETVSEKPRSVFFLNVSEADANEMQENNGVIVQSKDNIDDNILIGSFFKVLPKNLVCENGLNLGWKSLINFNLPPSNSLVISDNYLFKNEDRGINIGERNIINLIDSILPQILSVEYHILIIAEDNNKSAQWCEKLKTRVSKEIKALRPYQISIEFLFSATIHKRVILSNYLSGSQDKGFSVFSTRDNKTVREDNDFRLDRVFNSLNSFGGDVEYISKKDALQRINKKSTEVFQWLKNQPAIQNRRILGDCNADYTTKNRLLNDV
jgi:hypothetical protein